MTNIFKRLLHKEFGEESYNRFFQIFQQKLSEKKTTFRRIDSDEMFGELCTILEKKDSNVLEKMEVRLLDAMSYAVRVSRTYFWTFLFYLSGALFLIAMNLHPYATLPALIIMSGGFLFKTYEFVINKYSYIDAYMILVYKAALETVLRGKRCSGEDS